MPTRARHTLDGSWLLSANHSVRSKVCPLAGFLSSILSLGGNIVPDEITDSDSPRKNETSSKMDESVLHLTDPVRFAMQVAERARQLGGRFPTASICGAMASQLVLVGAILGGCYFLSAGTLISWWCDVSPSCRVSPLRTTPVTRFASERSVLTLPRRDTGCFTGTPSSVSAPSSRTLPAFLSPRRIRCVCGQLRKSSSARTPLGSCAPQGQRRCAVEHQESAHHRIPNCETFVSSEATARQGRCVCATKRLQPLGV